MRKILAITGILCALCASVNASSMITEWTGGAGTSELNNSSNWSNGVPTRDPGNSGPDVIFNDVGELVLTGGAMVNSSDGGSITVRGNSKVTISGSQYTGNINIGVGCELTMGGSVDFKNTQMILDGIYNVGVCGVDGNATTDVNIIFGTSGLFNVNQGIWGAGRFAISGHLNTTSSSLAASEFQFITRTLVNGGGFNGGSMKLGDFTAADGSVLTKSSSAMSGNAADFEGQYYVYQDGGQIKVQYVVGGGAVPEPTTATLGLLGLAVLAMRRRRA